MTADAVLGRQHLSDLHGMLQLAVMMFERSDPDHVLELMVSSVPSISSCAVDAVYIGGPGGLTAWAGTPTPRSGWLAIVDGLGDVGGAVDCHDGRWRFAYPFRAGRDVLGQLLVSDDEEPPAAAQFLLRMLGHQTASALANARAHESERRHSARLQQANGELTLMVARLEYHGRVQSELTEASARRGGVLDIAQCLHHLTGGFVYVDDEFGHPIATAGDAPAMLRHPSVERLRERGAGGPGPNVAAYERGSLATIVQSGAETYGVIGLALPRSQVGDGESFAVQYASTLVALELAHQRSLAEVELRLRRDLVEDLVEGTDPAGAVARAAALGHDLQRENAIVLMTASPSAGDSAAARALQRALAKLRVAGLVSQARGTVTAVVTAPFDLDQLHRAVSAELGAARLSLGAGAAVSAPDSLPRSFTEARQALDVQTHAADPHGAASYDDLGIYRVLAASENYQPIDAFVREWLGALLDYDDAHGTDLVPTLIAYLESGGSYEATAEALVIHRNTVRYRLGRIQELGGFDLRDVDARLNVHIAARALNVLRAPTDRQRP
jgi:sugar diacid utilization regulator